MNRSQILTACVLVCALGGCKSLLKKREAVTTEASATAALPSAPPPVVSAPPPPPSAVASAAPAAENDDAIPTSQDFEDEAAEKVTTANFKAELSRLKKEIEKK